MSKTIAFFGDSFVGKYEGWVKHFCLTYDYECLHIGKPGADPVYPFEKWKTFNETYEGEVDVCVYAHTEPSRLYHPSETMGITSGVASDPPKLFRKLVDKDYFYFKAAADYFKHLVFGNAEMLKSILFPMGIDRYIEENNRVFKKIIHIWSFAPERRYREGLTGWSAVTAWPFDMRTGMNVILDLSNLSAAEPNYVIEQWDHRPLHFSHEYSHFVPEIIDTAINHYKDGGSLDFRPLVNEFSTWDDYVTAYNILKRKLDENSNNR
jgi:hypothetical protein